MELNLLPLLQTLLAVLITLTWVTRFVKKKTSMSKYNLVPEIPGRRFITGHLHLLSYPMRPHIGFSTLAKKYGPIFTMRPGTHKTLVVSDAEIAKECFTTQDLAFATRPIGFAHKVMGYNCAMFAFSPYGTYWREARKIATFKLLTAQKLEHLRHVRAAEVREAMKGLHGLWSEKGGRPVSIEVNQQFEDLVFNIVMRYVAGRKYLGEEAVSEDVEVARAFRRAAKEFNRFLAVTVAYDALPFLGWLDLKGDIRSMKKNHDIMDSIMQGWVDEHRRQRKIGSYDHSTNKDTQNFIDALLDMEDDGSLSALHTDTNTVVKATALNLIIAGVENTAITMVWIITLLLKHPDALQKALEELDAIVGKDRIVNESDITNLVYLQAIVKETMRLYPAAPLLVPHEAMEDCVVRGYHVPRGTRLVVNSWMIQRDPRVWSDPDKFYPERFLTSNAALDVKGQNFEIIPFGSGRRMCPGYGFALQVMQLTLAHLMHGFDWMVDPEKGLDLEEGYGVSLSKLNPLHMLVKPRLAEELYASM